MKLFPAILIVFLALSVGAAATTVDSAMVEILPLPSKQLESVDALGTSAVAYFSKLQLNHLETLANSFEDDSDDASDFIYDNEFLENFPFIDQRAMALQAQLEGFIVGKLGELGNILTDLTGLDEVKFPAGMQYETPTGVTVSLLIEGIDFDESTATLRNLLLSVQAVGSPKIIFGAPFIKFSRLGGFQKAVLGLIGDVPIPVNGSKETMVIMRGYNPVSQEGCFATFGCDGLERVDMKVTTYISRKLVLPVDLSGKVLDGYVYGDIKVQGSNLDNISGGIDIAQSFKINGVDNLVFSVEDAWFDGDEISTPESIYFPKGYFDETALDMNRAQWKGLSLGKIGVKLQDFFGQDTDEDPGVELRNFLIDRFGVTGEAMLTNPLPLEKGKIGTARISIEELSVALYKSSLEGIAAHGKLTVPGLDDGGDGGIGYTACIHEGGWYAEASLEPGEGLPFPLLKDALVLSGGTSLAIGKAYDTKETVIQVNLCGKTSLGSVWPSNDPNADAAGGISFQDFRVQSISPAIQSIGYWDVPESISFPAGPMLFTLGNVHTGMSQDGAPRIYFEGEAGFSGDSGFNLSGAAGVSIYGGYADDGRLIYDRTEVDKVGLCVATSSFAANVELHWFDDMPGYGSGFKGRAGVALRAMGYDSSDGCDFTEGIQAAALFGNINDARYYNFELLYVNTEEGIPLGPLAIHGLGGAISNRMVASGIEDVDFVQVDYDKVEGASGGVTADFLGESILGLGYAPDESAGFSLKFMSIMATEGSSNLANMMALLSFNMNTDGGLDSIVLDVQGQMFEEIKLEKIYREEVPIYFQAKVIYDNVNKDFLLAAEVDIETDAGVRGGGKLTLEAGPPGWYLHIGYPGEVKNIGIVLPVIGLETNAYFCAGNYNVPDMPPLPTQIRDIFSGASNQRSFNTGDELGGMAFGAHLDLGDPEEKSFLFFYYKLHILLGLDINIRNYKGYACGSDPTFGVNQWYAKGQVYAYLDGAVGLKAAGKKFPILELTTAFKIYLEAPAPTYGEFGLMVKYKVLGGLVKGRAKIEASFGNQCDFSKQSLELNVFDDLIYPENGDHARVTDNITFSGGVPFYQTFPDDGGNALFRIELSDVTSELGDSYGTGVAYYEQNGQTRTITCKKTYSSDNTMVTYTPDEIWPPNTRVWIKPRARFQQSTEGRSNWRAVPDQNGRTQLDTLYEFTTRDYPSFVPEDNIASAYPADGMSNYYPDEFMGQCFIQLKKGMEFLFVGKETKARLINQSTGSDQSFPCNYVAESQKLEWTIPSTILDAETLYSLTFEIEDQEIAPAIHFRTSRYKTLGEKLDRIFAFATLPQPALRTIEIPIDEEPFDEWELYGDGSRKPLLDFVYDLGPLYATYPSSVEPNPHLINAANYLIIHNKAEYTSSSYQEIPKILVSGPDKIGEKPRFAHPAESRQVLVSKVHHRFVNVKASEILKDGYGDTYLNDLKIKYGETEAEGAVEAWRFDFVHPDRLTLHWTYQVGELQNRKTTKIKVRAS